MDPLVQGGVCMIWWVIRVKPHLQANHADGVGG